MRPLSADHAAAVVAWRNDPANAACFLTQDRLTHDGQLAWTQKQQADRNDHTHVAELSGRPVGMVAIYGVDEAAGEAEYGRILVDRAWRRRGLGHAISAWALDLAFTRLGLKRVYAHCLAANHPIHTLIGQLGFAESARDAGTVRFEISRDRWLARTELRKEPL